MENENKRTDKNEWLRAEHQGDWQLEESQAEETAEMLTAYHPDDKSQRLYPTGDDPEEERDETEDEPRDWGHTDPLDSPLPDSTDPSGPGSAV